jgi:hypothetical protein
MIEFEIVRRLNGGDETYSFDCPFCFSKGGPNYNQAHMVKMANDHLTLDHRLMPDRIDIRIVDPVYCEAGFHVGDRTIRCQLEKGHVEDHESWYMISGDEKYRVRWVKVPA